MVLIGLMGTKGTGKTTGGLYLIDKYAFIERSFADCLKEACKLIFLLTDEQVYGTQEQKETPDNRWYNCTPRKILQFVGTELFRDKLDEIMPGLGKNIFTHHFKLWYNEKLKQNPNLCVVVPDVRFQNECDFIQSLGGIVIKIERSSVNSDDIHSSEVELKNITSYNYLVDNSNTVDILYQKIDECLINSFGDNISMHNK